MPAHNTHNMNQPALVPELLVRIMRDCFQPNNAGLFRAGLRMSETCHALAREYRRDAHSLLSRSTYLYGPGVPMLPTGALYGPCVMTGAVRVWQGSHKYLPPSSPWYNCISKDTYHSWCDKAFIVKIKAFYRDPDPDAAVDPTLLTIAATFSSPRSVDVCGLTIPRCMQSYTLMDFTVSGTMVCPPGALKWIAEIFAH